MNVKFKVLKITVLKKMKLTNNTKKVKKAMK